MTATIKNNHFLGHRDTPAIIDREGNFTMENNLIISLNSRWARILLFVHGVSMLLKSADRKMKRSLFGPANGYTIMAILITVAVIGYALVAVGLIGALIALISVIISLIIMSVWK